jgi:hypothetical protein
MQTDLNTRIDLVTYRVNRPSGKVYVGSLFQADTLAPQQYQQSARRTLFQEPEQELMFAVLKDAICCFQKYASARDKMRTRLYLEARKWLMEEDNDWPFSFANICEAIGLSPQYVRAGLLGRQEAKLANLSKARNV